jgi:calcineurin-like phosphoesterase
MRILMLGEIIGREGINVIKTYLPHIKDEYSIDIVTASVFFFHAKI